MIPIIGGIQSSKIHRDRKYNAVCQGLQEVGTRERVFNEYRVFIWEDEKVLETGGGDGHTTM